MCTVGSGAGGRVFGLARCGSSVRRLCLLTCRVREGETLVPRGGPRGGAESLSSQGPAAAQAQGYAESHRKAYCENYTLLRDAKSTRYAHYTIPGGSNCAVSSRPGRQLATQLIMHARYMANYGAMR